MGACAALAALAATAAPASAWDAAGHETVAAIAVAQLTKDAQQTRDASLRQRAQKALAMVAAIIQADPRHRADIEAMSTWPDEIKRRRGPMPNVDPQTGAFQDPSWHYVDIPYTLAAGQTADAVINPPGVTIDPEKDASGNVVTGIRYYAAYLKQGQGDATRNADALSWLTHLVGDVHQPLHCVTVTAPLPGYTPPPRGDLGGNGFKILPTVARPEGDFPISNLHSFWDDQLDLQQSLVLTPTMAEAEVQTLMTPRSHLAIPPTLEPADWAKESYALHESVYRLTPNAVPPAAYTLWAQKVACDRIVTAGVRLARLLEATGR